MFVALGMVHQSDVFAGGQWRMPRLDFFIQALQNIGWTRQEIADTFEFGHTLRCPLPPKQEPKGPQKKLCGRWSVYAHTQKKYDLTIFFDWSLWVYFGKARKADDVMHRVVDATLALDKDHSVSARVLTIWDPQDVRNAPDTYDIEMWTASLSWIRFTLEGRKHDPFAGTNYMAATTADQAIQILDYFSTVEYAGLDIETGNAPHALDVFSKKFKVLTIQLSAAPGTAYVIPLWHKDCPLAKDPRVVEALRRFSKSPCKIVAHNGIAFDVAGLNYTLGTEFDVYFDTMLADGILNENRQHKLKEIILIHVPSMAFYDDELEACLGPGDDRDYELQVPLPVLCRYGAADADVVLRMFYVLAKRLVDMPSNAWPNMWDFFMQHVMRDAKGAAEMTLNGMVIDLERRDALTASVKTDLEAAKFKVLSDERVVRFSFARAAEYTAEGRYFSDSTYIYHAFHTAKHGLQPIYDIVRRSELEKDAQRKLVAAKVLKKNGDPYRSMLFTESDVRFNMSAPDDTIYMVLNVLHLRSEKQTAGGKMSVDAEVLKQFAKTDPWFQALLDFRALDKRYSTYARPVVQGLYQYVNEKDGTVETKVGWIRDDGLVHGEFMLTGREYGANDSSDSLGGTRTGRKSAKNPNTTNFIKHKEGGSEVYSLFTSRYADPTLPFALDEKHAQQLWEYMTPARRNLVKHFVFPGQPGSGAILVVDYSQLELRVFAIVVHSIWMLSEYMKENVDLHAQLAMSVFMKTLDEVMANNKYLRFLAKKLWFGPIYMQGVTTLHAELVSQGAKSPKNPNELITRDDVQEMLDALYRKLPEFQGYKAAVESQLHKSLCIYSVCGRRRFLPQITSPDHYIANKAIRQGVNFGVQSPGADCTNWSCYTLIDWYKAWKIVTARRPLVVNAVHDCLVQDAPSELVPEMWFATKMIMENVPWSMLNPREAPIVLKAEGEVGPSWGEVAEIKASHEKFWIESMRKNGGSFYGLWTVPVQKDVA